MNGQVFSKVSTKWIMINDLNVLNTTQVDNSIRAMVPWRLNVPTTAHNITYTNYLIQYLNTIHVNIEVNVCCKISLHTSNDFGEAELCITLQSFMT